MENNKNILQSFIDENLGEVRVLLKDGEIWFVAADICRALGINNPRQAMRRLSGNEYSTVSLNDGREFVAGARYLNIVNEPGMWRLVLASRKPSAESLKTWLTHTVLPSIRKNGGYIEGQEALPKEEFEKLNAMIKNLRKQVESQSIEIASLSEENEQLHCALVNARRDVYDDENPYAYFDEDGDDYEG